VARLPISSPHFALVVLAFMALVLRRACLANACTTITPMNAQITTMNRNSAVEPWLN
jgi:hypothetical protein